jgi:flagellar export protein FliJ
MKPFKKSLAAVGTVRQRLENEALQAYAVALMNRVRAMERLRTAEQTLSAAQADWQRLAAEGCDAEAMARHSAHCSNLSQVRLERKRQLTEAERLAEDRMQELLHARQERQAVDKFHARQRAAYERAIGREEQKAMDELAHHHVASFQGQLMEDVSLC